jgi:hypothetical protein
VLYPGGVAAALHGRPAAGGGPGRAGTKPARAGRRGVSRWSST